MGFSRAILLYALLSLLSLQLKAQSLKDTLNMDEVEIVFKNTTTRELNLDSSLSANSFSTLADILGEGTPIFIKNYGPGALATPTYRGSAAKHIRVTWNGMPLNSPMLGEIDLNLVPSFVLTGANLQTGANGIDNASGGIGGVLSLSSRQRFQKYLLFQQSAGSFNTWNTGLGAGYGKQKLWGDTKVYRNTSHNNFRYRNTTKFLSPIEEQENAAYELMGVMQKLGAWLDNKTMAEATVWYQQMGRQLPPLMTSAPQGESQFDKALRTSFFLKRYIENHQITLSVNHSTESLQYENTVAGIETENKFNRLQLALSDEWKLKKELAFSYGMETMLDHATSPGYPALIQRLQISVPLKFSFTPTTLWSLSFNARPELIDNKFVPLSAGIFASRYISQKKKLLLFLNGSRNYNYPTLNDLYWSPGGNFGLQPELGYMVEVGGKGSKKISDFSIVYDIAIFANYIENRIQWQPGQSWYWVAQNIGNVLSKGVEPSINVSYGSNKNSGTIGAKYSYTRVGEFEGLGKTIGRQLIYVPQHSTLFNFKLKISRHHINIKHSYTGERNTFDETLPTYMVTGADAGSWFTINQLRIDWQLSVNNIFNTEYQAIAWRPMPGRSFVASLKIYWK